MYLSNNCPYETKENDDARIGRKKIGKECGDAGERRGWRVEEDEQGRYGR
jgi:hypothetical protein